MKWFVYNRSLVKRDQILIDFNVTDNWEILLKEMNKDKVDEPFYYPNTFILLGGYAKACMTATTAIGKLFDDTYESNDIFSYLGDKRIIP